MNGVLLLVVVVALGIEYNDSFKLSFGLGSRSKMRIVYRLSPLLSTPREPVSEKTNIKEGLLNSIKTVAKIGTTTVVAGSVIGSTSRMARAEENVCRLNELILPELKYSYNGNLVSSLLIIEAQKYNNLKFCRIFHQKK